MSNLESRALRKRQKILIPTDHPIADTVAKVLGAGLRTTSGRAERGLKKEVKAAKSEANKE